MEIKPPEFTKGSEVLRRMDKQNYDFVLAIGDDTTDEDMFRVLPPDGVSVKVGNLHRLPNTAFSTVVCCNFPNKLNSLNSEQINNLETYLVLIE